VYYDRDSVHGDARNPRCPLCGGWQTSHCGITPHGSAWICSRCCEAFYDESASAKSGEPAGVFVLTSRQIVWAIMSFCFLLFLLAVTWAKLDQPDGTVSPAKSGRDAGRDAGRESPPRRTSDKW
jgi:hypothetical protein